jgi:hypothetical protein
MDSVASSEVCENAMCAGTIARPAGRDTDPIQTTLTSCGESLKSFLFTLNSPHNFTARKFALRAEEKQNLIQYVAGAQSLI